ncbi:rhodanese-like domain-containing protein [Roseimicrobium sp. ORNL1]|uniref:rhodanese-like domain-containing protein n=1 Tax=Roseimicrobium sp. ORNL1 TaxID=2711231 RepID=UPI0013E19AA0|nr:rhodanese-like domain-containing protein [Roseimicrobium sp. ORNL1]QIF00477.1 rhodanese-like domain-containing protein [Roseimicrobium sp. ORNL1]
MKTISSVVVILLILTAAFQAAEKKSPAQKASAIANPQIDYPGFLKDADKVGVLREKRRITEKQFLEMMQDPDTIILDARSTEKYGKLHIKGAKNLSLPDMTEADLAKVIPSKITRVLIYCNNNFDKAPEAFPGKGVRLSLNIFTFNTLYGYGYTNVYELGPFIDISKSVLPFTGKKQ